MIHKQGCTLNPLKLSDFSHNTLYFWGTINNFRKIISNLENNIEISAAIQKFFINIPDELPAILASPGHQ